MHKILLDGVRNEKKTQENLEFLGGTMSSTAAYVPPLVEDLADCLKDL